MDSQTSTDIGEFVVGEFEVGEVAVGASSVGEFALGELAVWESAVGAGRTVVTPVAVVQVEEVDSALTGTDDYRAGTAAWLMLIAQVERSLTTEGRTDNAEGQRRYPQRVESCLHCFGQPWPPGEPSAVEDDG